jgi:nucleoside phosphorylase
MPRAVILTALPVEYLAVRSHLSDLQEEMHPQGTIYERGKFIANDREWEVGVVETGAGNAGSAIEAERAIAYFKPDVLIFVGIAGGIKDVAIGDVVAATKVYGYESGKVGEQFSTRPAVEQSAHDLVQRAKLEAGRQEWLQRLSSNLAKQPRVFVAPIASGEKVVAFKESELFKFLRASYNDAIAVEMEGFGFLSAAFAHPEIKAIMIRGISDLIKGKNDDSPESGQEPEQIRQEKASHHASAFAFEILAKFRTMSGSSRTPLPLMNLDRSGAASFLGRAPRLDELHKQLQGNKQRITAIIGMGGIGKTELALQYASAQVRLGQYPAGICWLRARDQDIAARILEFAQTYLDLVPPDQLEIKAQVAYCWRRWPGGEALVVLDDVTDYKAIEPYLPPPDPRFKLLITTRNKLGCAVEEFPLEVLDKDSAITLLESLTRRNRPREVIQRSHFADY